MMKLWNKGDALDSFLEQFATGTDFTLDQKLIFYDCVGTLAHATMLTKIGILSSQELQQLKSCILDIIKKNNLEPYTIPAHAEDVHTFIENLITAQLGPIGQKIHTARSRNDQIIVDIRLFARDQLMDILENLLELASILNQCAQQHEFVPLVGRTHFQPAMISSVGLWLSAFAESLLDDASLLLNAYDILNQNPLGSAASYGAALPIDRALVAQLLGFDKVQNNVLYVNNSRGKFESIALSALNQIMIDLAKLSTDTIIFSSPEFGYLTLPKQFCFGSSIMPQKQNPDPLELVRAKSASVMSNLFHTLEIIRSLPSGYNRDFQETKKPFFEGLQTTAQSLKVCSIIFKEIQINEVACAQAIKPELFATDYALQLAQEGTPFRQAYKLVAQNLASLETLNPVDNLKSKNHLGAPGNLGLANTQKCILELQQLCKEKQATYQLALNTLLKEQQMPYSKQ
ncbi:argininosuccinate lyase [soil metagenome]